LNSSCEAPVDHARSEIASSLIPEVEFWRRSRFFFRQVQKAVSVGVDLLGAAMLATFDAQQYTISTYAGGGPMPL
jgi:hypothetical protein